MIFFYKEEEWVEENPVENDDEYVKVFEKSQGHPIITFFRLYKGNYWRFLLAGFFFVLKNSPVWVLPIITSNIINIATNPAAHSTSEIIRDVESVQSLSSQIFSNMLTIFLNIFVALAVTITKSLIVFMFFLITVPIAGATMGFFRKGIRRCNREFRKQMEETSTRVVEMVDLIPVTRAHALENEEIKKMGSYLNGVAHKGFKLDILHANFGAIRCPPLL